jgi:hypothetical protein
MTRWGRCSLAHPFKELQCQNLLLLLLRCCHRQGYAVVDVVFGPISAHRLELELMHVHQSGLMHLNHTHLVAKGETQLLAKSQVHFIQHNLGGCLVVQTYHGRLLTS